MNLKGKVALVTGGGSGIGTAISVAICSGEGVSWIKNTNKTLLF